MAQKTANFDLGTSGNVVAAADAGSADAWNTVANPGSAITYSTTQKRGPLAAKIDGTSAAFAQQDLEWTDSFGLRTYGRAYVYPTAAVGGRWIAALQAGVTFIGSISVSNVDRTLGLGDKNGAPQAASVTPLPLNQWTRIEFMFFSSATVGQIEVKMFVGANVDGTSPDETVTTPATINTSGNAMDSVWFGNPDGAANVAYWDDIVGGANSYPGPTALASSYTPASMKVVR